MTAKTPISLLQELVIKDGFVPMYKLIYNQFSGDKTFFKIEVSVNGQVAVGEGSSKKDAKHNAAKLLLLKLKGEKIWSEEIFLKETNTHVIKGNIIGELQEYCAQRGLPIPVYTFVKEDGPPHERIFTMGCVLSDHFTEGKGLTKKLARQQASHDMFLKIKDNNDVSSSQIERKTCTSTLVNSGIKNIKKNTGETEERKKFKELLGKIWQGEKHSNIYNSEGKMKVTMDYTEHFLENVLPFSLTLRFLIDCDKDYVAKHHEPEYLLNKITSEVNFTLKYSFLNSKSPEIKFCNLHLTETKLKTYNFIGSSDSNNGAKKTAIIKCLEFLIIICK